MTLVIRPQFRERAIRSFVIRSGRMTDAQQRAFDDNWPHYGLSLEQGPLDPQANFGRQAPLVLEIGFGMGDSLAAMAAARPDEDFIGVEVHPPGVGRLVNLASAQQLGNLRVYCADATDVLGECIADASLSRIQVFFPDPWHKKKHHKRRLIQPALVTLLARKLAPGGCLHLATDWQPYAEWMLEVLAGEPALHNCAGDNHYSTRPDYRPVTKFERRGEQLGHPVFDLIFAKG